MKIRFNIEYRAAFGENLMLNILPGGAVAKQSQHKMTTIDGMNWSVEVNKALKAGDVIDYYYNLVSDKDERRHEWVTEPHRLELVASQAARYTVFDHWIDIPEDSYLYSSAFTECVMKRERSLSPLEEYQRTVRLKVRAPQLRNNQKLAIVGEPALLGEWNVEKAVLMTEHECNEWVVSLDASKLPTSRFEFKFVILDSRNNAIWEQIPNRSIEIIHVGDGEVVVYELSPAYFPLPAWKGAGVVVPVFSLRSWAAKTSQSVIQVLPINDTNMTQTWQDSYPYNSISIYALHPQYVDFRQMPQLKDEAKRQEFEALRQELNALSQIDYERVFQAKLDYLHLLFDQEWTSLSRTADYKDFYAQNKEWLVPYAEFCYYRDLYGTAVFNDWPNPLPKADKKVTAFWCFVQYYLDRQMRSAHEYARQHQIILKGDIPIGISRDGVEAWVEPKYFNLNGQAGAPPDAFSADGQNWGFPTYNWDEMLKDGCQWWVRRFRKMSQFFDAYRIDHVLGFFRIWEIPVPEKSGLMGQFAPALGLSREEIEGYGIYGHDDLFLVDHKRSDRWHPRIAVQYQEAYQRLDEGEKYNFNRLYNDYFYRRNNHFWYQEAMKKLPRLTQATRMLCCAEDLGMVPDCVPWVMNELRILSLEIQTMPKDPSLRFGKLKRNPYRSVCTFSTHDMPTLRQWWDEDYETTQAYYNISLRRGDAAPHPLPGWLAKDIVSRQLTSPSMLCLLSLQDWLAMDETLRLPDADAERINIPANPRHYWRYRMHLTIEQLLKEDDFNNEIKTLITQSGRK